MKRGIKFLLFLFFFAGSTETTFSQITFSVDSLKISKVLWLCQNDVVIEDFAYGPHFKMMFSIKNTSQEVVCIPSSLVNIQIRRIPKQRKRRHEVFPLFQACDSIIVLNPNCSVSFWGYTDWNLTGDIIAGNNYRLVCFIRQIEKILQKSKVILDIQGLYKEKATFKNCYSEKNFFIDGTAKESIYNVEW